MSTPKVFSDEDKFDEKGYYRGDYVRALCDSVDTHSLCDALDIRFGYGSWHSTSCPIHGGDNPHGFGIREGTWRCFTHNCHEKWGGNLVGLVRAIKGVSRVYAIRFLENLVNSPIQIKPSIFQDDYEMLQIEPDVLRKSLQIPCPYFIKRGFSPTILEKYDVGYCSTPHREMTGRTVVPIFDDDYRWVVGCTGRSVLEKCPKCQYCHEGECSDRPNFSTIRWKHNKGLKTAYHLFNLWFSKKSIMESGRIVLTEGPCDCIRLAEGGVENSVALFGVDLKRQQEIQLQKLGIRTVVLALDPDAPGQKSSNRLADKLSPFYNVERVAIPTDPGKMKLSQLQKVFRKDIH